MDSPSAPESSFRIVPVTVSDGQTPEAVVNRFAIEFPGYVRDPKFPEKALDTFGGLQGLRNQRKAQGKTLKLKLRPEDEYCHPIASNDAKKANLYLLRLEMDDKNSIQSSSLTPVPQIYQFNSPADMQIVNGPSGDLLKCVPPVFQIENKVEYAVDAYGSGRESNVPEFQAFSSLARDSIVFDYNTPHVPADSGGFFEDGFQKTDKRLSNTGHILREIFAKRPVCNNGALAEKLSKQPEMASDREVNEQLNLICYRFSSGPWRSSWVRKGYDPRNDRSSAKYHVITIRNGEGNSSDEDIDDVGDNNTDQQKYGDIRCLKVLPRQLPTDVHLLDIQNEYVQERLRNSLNNPSRACTEECGWHIEFNLSKICDFITETLGTLKDPDSGTEFPMVAEYNQTEPSQQMHAFSALGQGLDHQHAKRVMNDDQNDNNNNNNDENGRFFDILQPPYHAAVTDALSKFGKPKK
jgi:hypothetical protein